MNNNKVSYKEVSIKLKKIQESKFYYNLDFQCDCDKLDEDNLPYKIEVKYNISYDLPKDIFYINVSICYKDEDNLILEAENRFTFKIKNLGSLIKVQDDDTFSLKVDFLPTLINVAVGTMRGVIFSKTNSSPLSDFPLPMISMSELIDSIH